MKKNSAKSIERQRLEWRDRDRRRRLEKVRREAAARGIDPARTCGLTGKACRFARDCQWNEEMRQTHRHRQDSDAWFAKHEVCTTAIRLQIDRCEVCGMRRRCGEVWRCFRVEAKEREARRFPGGAGDSPAMPQAGRLRPQGGKREISRFEGGLGLRTGKDRPKGRGANCNGVATGPRGRCGTDGGRPETAGEEKKP